MIEEFKEKCALNTIRGGDSTSKIPQIMDYWFGGDHALIQNKDYHYQVLWSSKWFGGLQDHRIDNEIKQLFYDDVQNAIHSKYDHWRHSASGTLCLILLLDQFTRNIYRNTPQSFAYDNKALNYCLHGIQNGFDQELLPMCRIFFYLPLLHQENMECQNKSVQLITQVTKQYKSKMPIMMQRFETLAIEKRDNIVKFGRFPKRNKILGRQSTPEEEEYYHISLNSI